MRLTRRALAAGGAWAVTGARAESAENTLARVKRSKLLRVGAVAGQPPYCYKDLASGEWRGFLIDISKDLAGELGATVQPVESTWGNAVLDLQANKVDIFFGLAPTPQRALVVDFTSPLYQNAFALIARKGFNPSTWAELDDPAVRIALETGTQYDQAIPLLCPKAAVTRLKTNNEAMLAVQAGRADCQIIVVIFALTNLTRNPQSRPPGRAGAGVRRHHQRHRREGPRPGVPRHRKRLDRAPPRRRGAAPGAAGQPRTGRRAGRQRAATAAVLTR